MIDARPDGELVAAVAALVTERAGVVIGAHRRDELANAIARVAARAGTELAALPARLAADPALLDALFSEITVTESYFMRDPAQLDLVRSEVIPALIARRGARPGVRVWSAGCAGGEEAYSLAIVLEQCGVGVDADVLATDLSRAALARAARAVYPRWALRGARDDLVRAYFRTVRDGYELLPRIRARVRLRYLNLATACYPSPRDGTAGLDLVMCRNVMIYFEPETIAAVVRRLHASLAEDGWLIVGPSDPSVSAYAPFEPVMTDGAVAYRRCPARVTVAVSPDAAEVAARPAPPEVAPAAPRRPSAPHATRPRPSAPEIRAAPARAIDPDDAAARARDAYAAGTYREVIELAAAATDPQTAALAVRAVANLDGVDAGGDAAARALVAHPLAAELHFLEAMLRIAAHRDDAAEPSLRRALYLDPSLALAHFALGGVLARRGELVAARTAFRAARTLSEARPAGEPVALGDGQLAGALAVAAAGQLRALEGAPA